MLVENLARATATDSSEKTVKKYGSEGSVIVYAARIGQSQLVFYAKNLLVKNIQKTISE